jgi:hypothetical protein
MLNRTSSPADRELAAASNGCGYGVGYRGTDGTDLLFSDRVGDRLWARAGNDVVIGNRRNQWIDLGDGNDFGSGGDGNDVIFGGRGIDFIAGGGGRDRIFGGEGNDFLSGGLGRDTVSGGAGDDILLGSSSSRLFGLTAKNQLVSFDPQVPGYAQTIAVTGVDGTLVSIDLRPADGKLYGVSDTQKIYTLAVTPGQTQTTVSATLVSTITPNLLDRGAIAIDFNPVPDRLRVVSSADQNLRINVDTGAIADGDPATAGIQLDTPLAFASTDPNVGKNPNLRGIAYTNSVTPSPNPAGKTTLYGIDPDLDILVRQGGLNFPDNPPSPNSGQLFTLGQVRDFSGAAIDFGQNLGFDIVTAGPINFGYVVTDSSQYPGQGSQLYAVNLDLNLAARFGAVRDQAGKAVTLIDLAAVSIPDFSRNTLRGGDGHDFIQGDAGVDIANGGTGNDTFKSSAGNDVYTGGAGSDIYLFDTGRAFVSDAGGNPNGLGLTTIQDFRPGEDKIVLDKTTFTTLVTNPGVGLSAGVDFAIADTDEAARSGIATIAYSRSSGTLYYSTTGIASRPQVVVPFATLANAPDLQITDLQVVA